MWVIHLFVNRRQAVGRKKKKRKMGKEKEEKRVTLMVFVQIFV